jgi:hypothetical protein
MEPNVHYHLHKSRPWALSWTTLIQYTPLTLYFCDLYHSFIYVYVFHMCLLLNATAVILD